MLATADGLSREVRVAATRLAKTRVLKTPVVSTHKTTSWGQPLRLHFKLENQQQTGSFKVRGATNKVLQLDDASTVVTHSAGNHGAALAWATRQRGMSCTVVVPTTAPHLKKAIIKRYGANVIETAHENRASKVAEILAAEPRAEFVHPFDDMDVMAGQGTIGLELAEQVPHLDAVLVPVSGGGLAAGIASVLTEKVVLVEPLGKRLAMALASSTRLLHDSPLPLDTVADGMRSRTLGQRPWDVLSRIVPPAKVLSADDKHIVAGMTYIFNDLKQVCEPAGATALAALLSADRDAFKAAFGPSHADISDIAIIVCGGNLDIDTMLRQHYM